MTLQASIIASAIGVLIMTLSSGTEAHWHQRGDSPAPGRAFLFPLQKVFGFQVEGRLLFIISHWVHWLYGAAWGVVWWLLLVEVGLNLFVTTIVFGAIVWTFAALSLKASGIAPWPWRWGLKWNIVDWTHHFFYITGTLLGWVAIEKIVEGTGGSWSI